MKAQSKSVINFEHGANKPFTASHQTLLTSPHLTLPLAHHLHVHRLHETNLSTSYWKLLILREMIPSHGYSKHLTQKPLVIGILINVLRTIQP